MTKIVCISDTHTLHGKIDMPEGDILIHAGDLMNDGWDENDITSLSGWLAAMPYKEKIVIAGNHDFLFERQPDRARKLLRHCVYLEDKAFYSQFGFKIYGSPWQPEFYDWAFNLPRGKALADKWAMIPEGTDILITHGPPYGVLDEVPFARPNEDPHVGCKDLLETIVHRIKPRLHVFGHIHCGYGTHKVGRTHMVNASICNEKYQAVNPPIVIEI